MERLTKVSKILFFILLVIGILVISRPFLVPFLYGLLIALVIYPVCKRLERKKVPRGLAILISISLIILLFFVIIFVLILQLNTLNKEIPQLIQAINEEMLKGQTWIVTNFGISIAEQNMIIIDYKKNMSGNITGILSGTAMGLFNLVIIPVYAFLILFYRNVIVDFVISMTGEKYKEELPKILHDAIHTYYSYIKGMLIVYLIVGVLNSIGLFFLGVKYPLLFGMLTAFMTIVPYLGIIISSLLPISLSWMETKNIYVPLGIVGVFSFVQYLEAYFIFPYVVGKQLNINTFASIIIIIFGGLIWGVSGMLLFLPYAALFKLVSAKVEELKPFQILLEIPPEK